MMGIFQGIKQFGLGGIVAGILCLAGLIMFAIWLLKTSWGRKALADSRPRRNNMPFYLPFVPLFIWVTVGSLAIAIAAKLTGNLQQWQKSFLDNFIYCVAAIVVIAIVIFLVRISFARRLKGFGLNVKTIPKDFLAAVINLLATWPLVMVAIIVTIFLGKLIYGQDFTIEQHEELELITAYTQLPLRILIVILAIVIAPLLEEILFRGLFQTMVRSVLEIRNPKFHIRNAAWPAILISSALFVMVHTDIAHWPALFVLALCLGYSYEKSGSLFRPIFIHSFFNAVTIIAVLNQ
jgi:membrane protease YdiL (CAAX protease family)